MKKYFLTLVILCVVSLQLSAVSVPQWITAFENQNATNSWICFQKEFNINAVPAKALTRIAADSKYWLWINGKLVVLEGAVKRGPNPNDTYYDEVDIAPHLKQGHNLISALVWYFGKEGFSYNPSGQGAFLFDCQTAELTLQSDDSWKAAMHPAYYTPLAPILISVYLNQVSDLMQNSLWTIGKKVKTQHANIGPKHVWLERKAMHHGINCIIVSFRFGKILV